MILFTTLSTRQLLPMQKYVLFAFIMRRSYAEPNGVLGEAKIIPAQYMIQVIERENDASLMTMTHEKILFCILVNVWASVCKSYFFNKGK